MSTHVPRISAARIVLAVTALVVVYFLVAGSLNAIRSHQLRQQQAQLEIEIQELEERFQRLEALREYLNSDEYIEAIAREQLGLVHEGETAFVVISTAPSATPAPEEDSDAEPRLWWDILIR